MLLAGPVTAVKGHLWAAWPESCRLPAAWGQAEAEAGQARLQQQLREALQLHQLPEAHVQDTASPVNQILLLVDDLLDVSAPIPTDAVTGARGTHIQV